MFEVIQLVFKITKDIFVVHINKIFMLTKRCDLLYYCTFNQEKLDPNHIIHNSSNICIFVYLHKSYVKKYDLKNVC